MNQHNNQKHYYLTLESGNWCDKPFSIFLAQDGWSKAPKSLQQYLKKMFTKQFFFADANGAPDGGLSVDRWWEC